MTATVVRVVQAYLGSILIAGGVAWATAPAVGLIVLGGLLFGLAVRRVA